MTNPGLSEQDKIINRALAYYILPSLEPVPTRYNEHIDAARLVLDSRRGLTGERPATSGGTLGGSNAGERPAPDKPAPAEADAPAPGYRAGYLAALEAVHDRYEFGPERTIEEFDLWLHARILEARHGNSTRHTAAAGADPGATSVVEVDALARARPQDDLSARAERQLELGMFASAPQTDTVRDLLAELARVTAELGAAEARFQDWSSTDVPALNIALARARDEVARVTEIADERMKGWNEATSAAQAAERRAAQAAESAETFREAAHLSHEAWEREHGRAAQAVEALGDYAEDLRSVTWLLPVSAQEMTERDRWLADALDTIAEALAAVRPEPKETP